MKNLFLIVFAACGLLATGCQDDRVDHQPPPEASPGPNEETAQGKPQAEEPKRFHDQELSRLEEEVEGIEEETRRSLLPRDQEVHFPEGIPVPRNYVVLNKTEVGPMQITTLEVEEDLEELAARFNSELENSEHEVEPIVRDESEDFFQARGRIITDGIRVTITVSGEKGPLQKEGTGSVNYQVTTLESEEVADDEAPDSQ